MKKLFVFDKSEDDIVDIDETTIIKETGIDAAKVKENIMMEIRSEKKTKKTSVKKIFSIVAIAAAIAAAATVTVQATTGVFNPAFGDYFAGQPADGIFPGADISVNSDELNIEFVGVTGSETDMFSVYNITKKDGSSFAENADECYFLGTNAEMNVSESVAKKVKMMLDGGRGWGSGVSYDFTDAKTIRAMASYSDSVGYIKGERLTVTDTETTFYHTDEVLYSDETNTFMGCNDFMEENEDLMNEKKASLKDNQIIIPIITDGHAELVVATYTTVPLKYELGAKLNYKTTVREFNDLKDKCFSSGNTVWTVTNLKADSFSITLEAETNHDKASEGSELNKTDNLSDEKLNDFNNISRGITLEVTKKDGTKVHGMIHNSFETAEPNGYTKEIWEYNYFDDTEESKLYALDPADIVSVKLNGTEIIA